MNFNTELLKYRKEIETLKTKLWEEVREIKSPGLQNLDAAREQRRTGNKKPQLEKKGSEACEGSKRQLSKTVAELERKLKEEEKKNSVIQNKIQQTIQDKEKYKQRYNSLKKEIST